MTTNFLKRSFVFVVFNNLFYQYIVLLFTRITYKVASQPVNTVNFEIY